MDHTVHCARAHLMVLGQAFRKGGVIVLWGLHRFSDERGHPAGTRAQTSLCSHLSYLHLMTIMTDTPEVLSTAELVRATSKVGDKSK